ncbi:MAG: sulfotransferase [Chloroflexi bacterium]|nr:sulfotransferase [Chloroflexota bacterium]
MKKKQTTSAEEDFRVVYLLGMMPRSGTNFFFELICSHPDCGGLARIPEPFLMANADHLIRFVDDVHTSWNNLWADFEEALKEPLLKAIGSGLEQYLYSLTEETWVMKNLVNEQRPACVRISPAVVIARTPSVKNLHLVSQLTDAKVVVLVRDGRSVVESGMRSFGWLFEESIYRWAQAADTVLQVMPNNPQMMCIRYEDLLQNKDELMRELFDFVQVDAHKYDFTQETPVRGSSTYFDDNAGMNWDATQKSSDFNPLQRWHHWSRARHERFNWVAGKQLVALGYEPVQHGRNVLWLLYNVALDLAWPLRQKLRTVARILMPKWLRERILWNRGKRYRTAVTNN